MNKLVSMILLSYKNYKLIWDTIDSILEQDYSNIELIVTDDGSEEFSKEEVEQYIKVNKRENIKNVIVIANKINQGTVRNLNTALGVMTGDFYMNIGTGDRYVHNQVVSKFQECFYNNPEKLLVCANAAMYNENLTTFLYPMMTESDRSIAKSGNAYRIYNTLAYRCILLTVATCYRKEFIKEAEAYDESYIYAEDYPTFIRMARKGIVPGFLDEIVTHHAIGGIANGNNNYDIKFTHRYYKDKCLMWKNEIRPYWKRLEEKSKIEHCKRVENEKRNYVLKRWLLSKNPFNILVGVIRYPQIIMTSFKNVKLIKLLELLALLVFGSIFGAANDFKILEIVLFFFVGLVTLLVIQLIVTKALDSIDL